MNPPTDPTAALFLDFSTRKLRVLESRIETCLEKLNADQVWVRESDSANAIGNLVLHLCGNVRQWIVSGVGRRPDVRQRDAEFAARGGVPVPELIARLRETVDEALAVLSRVTPERLTERLTVQSNEVSVIEAIYTVVEHFSMHAGQIFFATKAFTGSDLGFYRHLTAAAAQGSKTP
ncbi:MAG TPA: DUF1572 family protein [Bryobacteraceae bacterium]|nr:DUF1572 family protein [Bryobacteraceae bacterium]